MSKVLTCTLAFPHALRGAEKRAKVAALGNSSCYPWERGRFAVAQQAPERLTEKQLLLLSLGSRLLRHGLLCCRTAKVFAACGRDHPEEPPLPLYTVLLT